jgi:hypothetical protein
MCRGALVQRTPIGLERSREIGTTLRTQDAADVDVSRCGHASRSYDSVVERPSRFHEV